MSELTSDVNRHLQVKRLVHAESDDVVRFQAEDGLIGPIYLHVHVHIVCNNQSYIINFT